MASFDELMESERELGCFCVFDFSSSCLMFVNDVLEVTNYTRSSDTRSVIGFTLNKLDFGVT